MAWLVAVGFTVLSLSAAAQAAPVLSSFDTDGEGWSATGDVHGETWLATEGQPPGCFKAIDDTLGDTWAFVAPAKFLGDQSNAYGDALSYDLWISARDPAPWAYPWIALIGGGMELDWSGALPAVQAWNHYEASLTTAGGWKVGGVPATETQMQTVLSNLTAMRIRGEFLTGSDYGYIDNVSLVPEPATLALIVAGAMAILRRRRA